MGKSKDYQEAFLCEIRRNKISVLVYLSNGFQIRGIVKNFDNYIVLLESEGKQQMIYKHAISTIIPSKAVQFNYESDGC